MGETLSAENKKQLWIPEGFAHGFLTLSDTAEFRYKTTNYYAPNSEGSICWNEPDIAIEWLRNQTPIISYKDQKAHALKVAKVFE